MPGKHGMGPRLRIPTRRRTKTEAGCNQVNSCTALIRRTIMRQLQLFPRRAPIIGNCRRFEGPISAKLHLCPTATSQVFTDTAPGYTSARRLSVEETRVGARSFAPGAAFNRLTTRKPRTPRTRQSVDCLWYDIFAM